jgi:acid stress chaperone HdeA
MTKTAGALATALVIGMTLCSANAQGETKAPASGTTGATSAKHAGLPKKAVDKVTCEDFNGLDDTFKPKAIAWAAGYQQGQKKPDVVVMDIDGVEKITPIVVDACAKTPHASFWTTVESELKKIF